MLRYRVNINKDPGAFEAYNRFRTALRLPPWAPPSDAQRMAFDFVFGNASYDWEKFLALAAKEPNIAQCIKESERKKEDGEQKGI